MCEDRINGFGNEEPQRIGEGVHVRSSPRENLVSGERVCRVGSSDARGVRGARGARRTGAGERNLFLKSRTSLGTELNELYVGQKWET